MFYHLMLLMLGKCKETSFFTYSWEKLKLVSSFCEVSVEFKNEDTLKPKITAFKPLP